MQIRNASSAAFGGATLALGITVLVVASNITSGFGYDVVGPALFPRLIGGGLIVAAILVIADAVLRAPDADDDAAPISPLPVAVVSAAILLEVALLESVGWVPMTAVLFTAGAWAFGDKRIMLNVAIGLVFGALLLAAFNYGLGMDLPAGLLAPVLDVGR